MTSSFISYFKRRADALARGQKASWITDEKNCLFCQIVRGVSPSHAVYEDEFCFAFLDILPIAPGHTLLVPKRHAARLTQLNEDDSAALGGTLPGLCRAICEATNQADFNLVNNNGYAQVVDHVHYHIVPAPDLSGTGPKRPQPQTFGDNRTELGEEEGEQMAAAIRGCVKKQFPRVGALPQVFKL